MPMRIEFTGEYAALMGGYVAFRQNLGFVMPESSQRWLRHMADLLYTMPLISEVIDMERAEASLTVAELIQRLDLFQECQVVIY